MKAASGGPAEPRAMRSLDEELRDHRRPRVVGFTLGVSNSRTVRVLAERPSRQAEPWGQFGPELWPVPLWRGPRNRHGPVGRGRVRRKLLVTRNSPGLRHPMWGPERGASGPERISWRYGLVLRPVPAVGTSPRRASSGAPRHVRQGFPTAARIVGGLDSPHGPRPGRCGQGRRDPPSHRAGPVLVERAPGPRRGRRPDHAVIAVLADIHPLEENP